MERAEAEAVYDAGREACVEFLVELTARYERQIVRLEARIERLEERLRENSSNSSRPPSADPPASRPQRERSPSGRKPGGQPGHEGSTRRLVADSEIDAVIDHWPGRCSGCGRGFGLGERCSADPRRHQLFELPEIAVSVTEHRPRAALFGLRQAQPGAVAGGGRAQRLRAPPAGGGRAALGA